MSQPPFACTREFLVTTGGYFKFRNLIKFFFFFKTLFSAPTPTHPVVRKHTRFRANHLPTVNGRHTMGTSPTTAGANLQARTMPPPPRLSTASVNALRGLLDEIVRQPRGSTHVIPCADPREAHSLRSRLNRIRSTDRQQQYGVHAAANRIALRAGRKASVIPADACRSIYDELIFRVDGLNVEITVGSMSTNELLALAGLAPVTSEATPTESPLFKPEPVGDHDTAPKSDEDPFA